MSPSVIFATAFVVGLSGAITPGPLLSVVIAGTARHGFYRGMLAVAGHGIAELLIVVLFLMGAGSVLAADSVAAAIAFGGGGVLLWMGYGMVSGALRGNARLARLSEGDPLPVESVEAGAGLAFLESDARANGIIENRGRDLMLVDGLVASVSNPYWFLWWATIGSGYISIALRSGGIGPFNALSFYLGHVLSDVAWYAAVGLAIIGGRRFLNDAVYRVMVGCCGLFLVGMAVYFVISGFRMLA